MVDIFTSTGIDPAEQKPDAPSSNLEFSQAKGQTLEQLDAETPAHAPTTGISNVPTEADAVQQTGQSAQPNTPNAQSGGDLEPGGSLPQTTQDQTAPAVKPETFTNGTTDLLATHSIPPPALAEVNSKAFDNGVDIADPQGDDQKAVADYANHVQSQFNTIAQTRYTPDEIQAMKDKGPISFFDAFNKIDPVKMRPPVTGPAMLGPLGAIQGLFAHTISDFQLKATADKLATNQPVSDAEHSQLQDYIDNQVELSQRGMTWGGKAAQVVTQLPSVMASFAGATLAAPETGGASLEGEAVIAKPFLQAAGDLINTGLQRAPWMPGIYVPKYAETRLNDAVAVTDKGDMIYKTAQEAPALAALKAYGYTAAMSVGQETAKPIGDFIGAGLEKAGAAISPILVSAVSKLPAAVQDNIYQALKLVQPNATLSNALSAVGWHGTLGQLGANRVTDALNGAVNLATDKNYTFDDYVKSLNPSAEQWALEAGLVAVGGSVHAATNLGMNILTQKGLAPSEASETLNNMSAQERENFVTKNVPNPTSEFPALGLDQIQPDYEKKETAYHGSPNIFDAFHTDHIGSGEGAQAFGYGLYFAGDKDVADTYRKGLSNKQFIEKAKDAYGEGDDPDEALAELKDQGLRPDQHELLDALQEESWLGFDYPHQAIKAAIKNKGEFEVSPRTQAAVDNLGSLYKVEVPSSDKLLDWDKSLISQPQYVKDALSKLGISTEGALTTGKDIVNSVNQSGGTMRDLVRAQGLDPNSKSVSDALSSVGIKGIRFLDGNSRGKGAGESNYVIFNHDDVSILGSNRQIYADAMQIDTARAAKQITDPPLIQENQSQFNKNYRTGWQKTWLPIYSELFNDIEAIQELSGIARKNGAVVPDGEDSKLLASQARMTPKLVEYNLTVGTAHFDTDGKLIDTGKSLKSAYDDFDNMMMDREPNMDQRHKDLSDWQIAQSLMEDQSKGRLEITPKQQGKYVDNLMRLAQKYGDKYRFFDTIAQDIYDWRNRILYNLVRSGEWTQAKYDQTVSDRGKYAPLSRITDDLQLDKNAIKPITAGGLGQDPNPRSIGSLKQRGEGNDLEIRDTFKSDMANAARIIQKSSVNTLLGAVAKFRDFYPEDVKLVDAPIKSPEVKGSYDPKLRTKLEETVKALGGSVERVKDIKAPENGPFGKKGSVLGQYDPMENLVKMKIGSTEGTLAHEVGHLLDEHLGLQKKMLSDPEIKSELQKLAEDRLNSDVSLRQNDEDPEATAEFIEKRKPVRAKFLQYVKSDSEVLANFFDAYVNSPDQVDKIAPNAKAAFEKIIDDDPKLAYLKDIKPSTSRAIETLRPETREYYGPPGSIPFYENGERKFMGLTPDIYKAFNNFSPTQIGPIEKLLKYALGAPAKLLRIGATAVPSFMMQHLERSVFSSFLNTEGKATPVDFAKGMFDVIGKSDEFHKWEASSGALKTFMPLDEKALDKAYTDIFAKTNYLDVIKGWEAVRNVSDYSGRVAVYNKLTGEGVSDLRAGLMSLEATGNYQRHGLLTKKLNPYIPFLNDTVQGADRFFRSYAKNPGVYTMLAMGTLTIPQLAITGYYLYGASDKDKQEYLRIPDYQRKEFYNFKVGDQWAKVRRPFAPGYLFGYVPEAIMMHLHDNNMPEGQNFYQNLLGGAASSLVPVSDISRVMPPAVRAYIQTVTNYDFFKQKPIYTENPYKQVPSDQKFNAGTSETSKLIGKELDLNPAKLDENVDTMLGTAGRQAVLPAGDAAINAARGLSGEQVNQKPTPDISSNPILGAFLSRTPTGYSTQPAIDFFTNYDALQKEYNAPPKGSSKSDRLAAAPGFDILEQARKQMSSNNNEVKQISNNPNIPPDEKATQIKVLDENIARIAEQANNQYYQQRGQRK